LISTEDFAPDPTGGTYIAPQTSWLELKSLLLQERRRREELWEENVREGSEGGACARFCCKIWGIETTGCTSFARFVAAFVFFYYFT